MAQPAAGKPAHSSLLGRTPRPEWPSSRSPHPLGPARPQPNSKPSPLVGLLSLTARARTLLPPPTRQRARLYPEPDAEFSRVAVCATRLPYIVQEPTSATPLATLSEPPPSFSELECSRNPIRPPPRLIPPLRHLRSRRKKQTSLASSSWIPRVIYFGSILLIS